MSWEDRRGGGKLHHAHEVVACHKHRDISPWERTPCRGFDYVACSSPAKKPLQNGAHQNEAFDWKLAADEDGTEGQRLWPVKAMMLETTEGTHASNKRGWQSHTCRHFTGTNSATKVRRLQLTVVRYAGSTADWGGQLSPTLTAVENSPPRRVACRSPPCLMGSRKLTRGGGHDIPNDRKKLA